MHILACEDPQVIYNKYLRERQVVQCGKCNTCRQRRASDWVSRLKLEATCHKYVVFFTLTYSDEFVPNVYFENGNYYSTKLSPTELDDFVRTLQSSHSDLQYFSNIGYRINVLCFRDVQLFVKRFRTAFHRKYQYYVSNNKDSRFRKESETIRYYIAGEYGETTLRPHYHGIFFFDNRFLADNFERILSDSWSVYDRSSRTSQIIGRTDWSFVQSSAAQYVASYLTGFEHLPRCLSHGQVRPHAVFSKCPPLGSLCQSETQVRKIFDNGLTSISLFNQQKNTFVDTPLSKTFANRLFPRIYRYSLVPAALRTECYRISRYLPNERFWDFSDDVRLRYLRIHYKKYDVGRQINTYVSVLTDDDLDYRPLLAALKLSRRVILQAVSFGVSLDYYVSRITLFYDNLDRLSLKNWFSFCEEYSRIHGGSELSWSDLLFIDKLYFSASSVHELLVKTYTPRYAEYSQSYDYRSMKQESYKRTLDKSVTKRKNDYLRAHPEKAMFVYK